MMIITSKLLFRQLRPRQWTKNLLIFAAPIFSISLMSGTMIIESILAFFLFSFVSGCVYILNDFVDRKADRVHPTKKYRPMASGSLNPRLALLFGIVLLTSSLILSLLINKLLFVILLSYFTLNIAYSFKLKNIVIIDIMIIAMGFVLRAIAGGVVIHIHFTPWFLICILFLALFLAISKRRAELLSNGPTRKVLKNYSVELLNQLSTIVTSATITSYAMFSFESAHTDYLMCTIPFVIYGIFRYLYLVHLEEEGESPERTLLTDKHILYTVLLYAIVVITVLKNFDH